MKYHYTMTRHAHFMNLALDLAKEAMDRGEVPVGAVMVRDETVIGRGYNLREAEQDPTAHAEILAIREAARRLRTWRLEGCTLYVTLEPCAMCAGALVLARVKTLVFGAFDPKAGFCGSNGSLVQDPRLNHRVEIISGVGAEEASRLLQTFFSALRT